MPLINLTNIKNYWKNSSERRESNPGHLSVGHFANVQMEVLMSNLKSNDKMAVEQMSTPLPAMAVKLPPMKPVIKSMKACQMPKSGMVSKVLRLCCLKVFVMICK